HKCPRSTQSVGNQLMIRFPRLLIIASCLFVAACDPAPDVAESRVFREVGVTFAYPSNWRVTENSEVGGGRIVYVEEPGSGLVVLTVYSDEYDVSLEEYAEVFSSNLGDALPLQLIKTQGIEGGSDSLDVRFSIGVLGASIPHTANITLHELGART